MSRHGLQEPDRERELHSDARVWREPLSDHAADRAGPLAVPGDCWIRQKLTQYRVCSQIQESSRSITLRRTLASSVVPESCAELSDRSKSAAQGASRARLMASSECGDRWKLLKDY